MIRSLDERIPADQDKVKCPQEEKRIMVKPYAELIISK
jgi:hypothetical protein